MKRKLTISASIICIVCGSYLIIRSDKSKPEDKLDNYSFSVGVWCAGRAIASGTPLKTNEFYKDGWSIPSGINHHEILHAARHFAITNGWPPFNNREGFTGDE